MDDIDSHINGKDGISLSVAGLTDIYPGEDIFNPFDFKQVDFIISNDIKASRRNTHYGNEFITKKIIGPEYLKSIDVRILKYIRDLIDNNSIQTENILKIINNYNCLIKMATVLENSNEYLPIREMSFENSTVLDISELSKMPVLRLK